jgi:DNA-directed RNA polymerase III subunit RPC5
LFAAEENSGDDDEEEAKQVTVKFARQENERFKAAKERSFNTLSKKSAEEPWRHVEYHSTDTHLSKVRGRVNSKEI